MPLERSEDNLRICVVRYPLKQALMGSRSPPFPVDPMKNLFLIFHEGLALREKYGTLF